jgi:hypothetical protein
MGTLSKAVRARRQRQRETVELHVEPAPPPRWLKPPEREDDEQEHDDEQEEPKAPLVTQGARSESRVRRSPRRWLRRDDAARYRSTP